MGPSFIGARLRCERFIQARFVIHFVSRPYIFSEKNVIESRQECCRNKRNSASFDRFIFVRFDCASFVSYETLGLERKRQVSPFFRVERDEKSLFPRHSLRQAVDEETQRFPARFVSRKVPVEPLKRGDWSFFSLALSPSRNSRKRGGSGGVLFEKKKKWACV